METLEKSSDFKRIEFGMADAKDEKTQKPNLLIEGFLDAKGYIDQIINQDKFIVLGPKGSGKTAIASKLELLANIRTDLCIKSYYLHEDFPSASFSRLLPSQESPRSRYQSYWEFLFLIAFLESAYLDKSCEFKNENDRSMLKRLYNSLTELELIPCQSISEMVKTPAKEKFRLKILKNIKKTDLSDKQKVNYALDYIFDELKKINFSIRSKNTHLLIVDGLDELMTHRDKQHKQNNDILSSLILSASKINNIFLENQCRSKIVILCRTDLFDKLEGSNIGKKKHDHAIILDWYQDAKDVYATNLVSLINLRAKASLKREVDVSSEFFPNEIRVGDPTMKTLLDHTRYRPRDIIFLLNNIQQRTRGSIPTAEDLWKGIRSYSLNYLINEINDELYGYLTSDEREDAIMLLDSMNKSVFSLKELEYKKNERFDSLDLIKVLNALFNCSAIGNVKKTRDYGNIYSMKYRNPYASFDPNEDIVIHFGLRKALNKL